jgi:hypothetical protein
MNCVARSRGNVDKEPVEARPNFRLASLHVDATGKRVYRDSSSVHIITLIGPATFRSFFEFFNFFFSIQIYYSYYLHAMNIHDNE